MLSIHNAPRTRPRSAFFLPCVPIHPRVHRFSSTYLWDDARAHDGASESPQRRLWRFSFVHHHLEHACLVSTCRPSTSTSSLLPFVPPFLLFLSRSHRFVRTHAITAHVWAAACFFLRRGFQPSARFRTWHMKLFSFICTLLPFVGHVDKPLPPRMLPCTEVRAIAPRIAIDPTTCSEGRPTRRHTPFPQMHRRSFSRRVEQMHPRKKMHPRSGGRGREFLLGWIRKRCAACGMRT